jgi:hypothetical protein
LSIEHASISDADARCVDEDIKLHLGYDFEAFTIFLDIRLSVTLRLDLHYTK